MKYNGCTSEHRDERSKDLLRAYVDYLRTHRHIEVGDTFRAIVNMPASRFYVSETRAAIVISNMLHGCDISNMRPSKREMFEEIYRRVLALMALPDYADVPIYQIVGEVIEQPAPKFYLSPVSARLYIKNARKEWHKRHLQRLRRLL